MRGNIDRLLEAAGRHVCDAAAADIHASRDAAIRDFPFPGYGFADHLFYGEGNEVGVIETKKEGVTLTRQRQLRPLLTAITEGGSQIEAGYYVKKQGRDTHKQGQHHRRLCSPTAVHQQRGEFVVGHS